MEAHPGPLEVYLLAVKAHPGALQTPCALGGSFWGRGSSPWSLACSPWLHGGSPWGHGGSPWTRGGLSWSRGASSCGLGGSPWGLGGSPWGLGGSFLVYENTRNFALVGPFSYKNFDFREILNVTFVNTLLTDLAFTTLEATCHSACQYNGRLGTLSVYMGLWMRGEKGLSYQLTEEEDGKTLYCCKF
jgi:hypothetical protein